MRERIIVLCVILKNIKKYCKINIVLHFIRYNNFNIKTDIYI